MAEGEPSLAPVGDVSDGAGMEAVDLAAEFTGNFELIGRGA